MQELEEREWFSSSARLLKKDMKNGCCHCAHRRFLSFKSSKAIQVTWLQEANWVPCSVTHCPCYTLFSKKVAVTWDKISGKLFMAQPQSWKLIIIVQCLLIKLSIFQNNPSACPSGTSSRMRSKCISWISVTYPFSCLLFSPYVLDSKYLKLPAKELFISWIVK